MTRPAVPLAVPVGSSKPRPFPLRAARTRRLTAEECLPPLRRSEVDPR